MGRSRNGNGGKGRRPDRRCGQTTEEIKKKASDYVWKIGTGTTQKQAVRWFDPVCPRVGGLDAPQASIVEDEVRRIALSVGAPVAAAPCRANFAILFTNDALGLMRKVDGIKLREPSPASLARLRRGTDPARWWYTTAPITQTSQAVSATTGARGQSKGIQGGGGGSSGGLPSNNQTTYTNEDRFSRLGTQTMRSFQSAAVVIQANGQPLSAVAAFAAFVGLAETNLGAAPRDSILSLFDGGDHSTGLTENDRAFLSALYDIRMDQRGEQQRRELIDKIVTARSNRTANGHPAKPPKL